MLTPLTTYTPNAGLVAWLGRVRRPHGRALDTHTWQQGRRPPHSRCGHRTARRDGTSAVVQGTGRTTPCSIHYSSCGNGVRDTVPVDLGARWRPANSCSSQQQASTTSPPSPLHLGVKTAQRVPARSYLSFLAHLGCISSAQALLQDSLRVHVDDGVAQQSMNESTELEVCVRRRGPHRTAACCPACCSSATPLAFASDS